RPVSCKFYESSKIRRVALIAFAALAVVSAGATLYAAFFFTALPSSVVTVFSTCALSTTAFSVGTYVLFRLKPSLNCPEYRLHCRKNAGGEIENGGLNIAEIRRKFRAEIVTDEDLNTLIRQDVQTLPYSALIEKWGEGVLDILDQTHQRDLRQKFLAD